MFLIFFTLKKEKYILFMFENITQRCVKIVQIRSYLWSIFSCICTEYGNLLRNSPNSIRIQENTDKIIPYLDTLEAVQIEKNKLF